MIYISPPFGTYFRPRNSIPVLGSFTLKPRSGRTKQVLKTFRKIPGGYINSIGLRNPGIKSLKFNPKVSYSLAGIEENDWEEMLIILRDFKWPHYILELNLSCPNVAEYGHPDKKLIDCYSRLPNSIISIKLPPNSQQITELMELYLPYTNLFHLSNTLPSPIGGISGKKLFEINLPLISMTSKLFPKSKIIAGGGIYKEKDALAYLDAGARHLSLGTIFMNPLRAYLLNDRFRFFK